MLHRPHPYPTSPCPGAALWIRNLSLNSTQIPPSSFSRHSWAHPAPTLIPIIPKSLKKLTKRGWELREFPGSIPREALPPRGKSRFDHSRTFPARELNPWGLSRLPGPIPDPESARPDPAAPFPCWPGASGAPPPPSPSRPHPSPLSAGPIPPAPLPPGTAPPSSGKNTGNGFPGIPGDIPEPSRAGGSSWRSPKKPPRGKKNSSEDSPISEGWEADSVEGGDPGVPGEAPGRVFWDFLGSPGPWDGAGNWFGGGDGNWERSGSSEGSPGQGGVVCPGGVICPRRGHSSREMTSATSPRPRPQGGGSEVTEVSPRVSPGDQSLQTPPNRPNSRWPQGTETTSRAVPTSRGTVTPGPPQGHPRATPGPPGPVGAAGQGGDSGVTVG